MYVLSKICFSAESCQLPVIISMMEFSQCVTLEGFHMQFNSQLLTRNIAEREVIHQAFAFILRTFLDQPQCRLQLPGHLFNTFY